LLIPIMVLASCNSAPKLTPFPNPEYQTVTAITTSTIPASKVPIPTISIIASTSFAPPTITPQSSTTIVISKANIPLSYKIINQSLTNGTAQQPHYAVMNGHVMVNYTETFSYPVVSLDVLNTDSVSGAFSIQFIFYSMSKDEALTITKMSARTYTPEQMKNFLSWWGHMGGANVTANIEPGLSHSFSYEFKSMNLSDNYFQWDYKIILPTKEA
jgi:hypothetical protein